MAVSRHQMAPYRELLATNIPAASVSMFTGIPQKNKAVAKVYFDEHLSQRGVGILALKNDAFGHNDTGAARGREVLGHVVHKQHFTALGLNGKTLMRFDATFRRTTAPKRARRRCHEAMRGEHVIGRCMNGGCFGGGNRCFAVVRAKGRRRLPVEAKAGHTRNW